MSLSDLIRHGVAAAVANAKAKAANSANGDAFEATAYSGLAKLAGLALATPLSENGEHWREFEMLLAIVGPAYKTPEDEYAQIRAVARHDLSGALICYRELLKQLAINEVPNE